MSIAEIFLMVWAGIATAYGVWVHSKAREFLLAHKNTAVLLAEVVTGEVVPTKDANDVWTVENDGMVMKFRKGDNHGI
jgi:hypothetical protein